MKIKLIDFGLKADHHPFRPHENDAGADVFMYSKRFWQMVGMIDRLF